MSYLVMVSMGQKIVVRIHFAQDTKCWRKVLFFESRIH